MKFKKLAAAFSAAVLAGTAVPCALMFAPASAAGKYNYAEALQKSFFFYEVQQSGVLPEWNQVSWRADSMVDESGKDTDPVPGGWFDAGDHFKFTLTNAYSAAIMAWGYIEYADAVKKAGLDTEYLNNIKWGMDYVLACDKGGGSMIGTVGDFTGGATDHNIWCSAEVYLRRHHRDTGNWTRPSDTIKNASVAALSAAALAEGYIIFKDENYLKHAKDLFEGADKIRDTKAVGGMGSMYPTSSWIDDCMFAACWLYKATGDESYLSKIQKDYIPNFPTESQSTDWKYTWGLCWDDTTQGAALLYAQITGDEKWVNHIDKHIRYWMGGSSDLKPFEGNITSDGLSHLTNWGCLRHATNTAFVAKLACDTIFKDDASKVSKYNTWADSQMNYCFGDNKLKLCYVLGMGDKNPKAIHHRTASGVHDDHWNELGKSSGGAEGWQTEYAHTLYGALIGGPDRSGNYDMTQIGVSNYEYSEVAIDYNAGYTACLCAMIDENGGTKLADFPPVETPKWDEWQVAAVLNGSGNSYTEVKAWAMNHTAWPARVAKDIEYRYYFDISELTSAGLSISDVTVEGKSQQYGAGEAGHATVSGPYKYEGSASGEIYYALIKFDDGRAICPIGQSEHRDEVQFRISIPDASGVKWDPANDPSYEGLTATDSLKSDKSLNKHITMYVDGKLVWGIEPDGTEPEPYTTPSGKESQSTTTETTTTTVSSDSSDADEILYGDVDCNGTVMIADAIMLARYCAEDSVSISAKGKRNANCYDTSNDALTTEDIVAILEYLAGVVTPDQLPKQP